MCPSSAPKLKNILPNAPDQPEKAPDPVAIGAGAEEKMKRKRNPLRIDLAASQQQSGVNV